MPLPGRIQWIDRFVGYSDIVNHDDPPKVTNDLNNVKLRFGRLAGRGGMSKYQSIATAASSSIIGLFNYRQADGSHDLIRLLRNGIEHIDTGAWASIEGTALSTVAETAQPQSTIIDDTLIFTNGTDRPQKYDGTTNSSPIASGTAPYCKSLIAYVGFLFAINVSDDGTFSDVFDGHRTGRYNDDWDTNWDVCDIQEIVLDETPGAWLNAAVIGRDMWCLKSDGVVKVTFTPGAARFTQVLQPVDAGILAPLSLGVLGNSMAFFLGTDGVVYMISASGVQAISYDQLSSLLPDTFSLAKLNYARGMVNPQDDTYYLFYDRTGLSNQLLNSYVAYNYRTREWTKGVLGVSINACVDFKATDASAQQLIVASPTLVENFDTTSITDDGVAFSRYYTTNWQRLKEEGWFFGADIIVERASRSAIKVSVAYDGSPTFRFDKVFSLSGGSVNDKTVTLKFRVPPANVETVNLKIVGLHQHANSSTEVQKIGLITQPKQQVSIMNQRGANQGSSK